MPVIVDDQIDMEPIVRDCLVLAMPLSPLCRPDCKGCAQSAASRGKTCQLTTPEVFVPAFLCPRCAGCSVGG